MSLMDSLCIVGPLGKLRFDLRSVGFAFSFGVSFPIRPRRLFIFPGVVFIYLAEQKDLLLTPAGSFCMTCVYDSIMPFCAKDSYVSQRFNYICANIIIMRNDTERLFMIVVQNVGRGEEIALCIIEIQLSSSYPDDHAYIEAWRTQW